MRILISAAFISALGLFIVPVMAEPPEPQTLDIRYRLVNRTHRFTDDQCFWSIDHGRSWHSFQDEPAPRCPRGNGRLYFALGQKPLSFDDRNAKWDFIEYATETGLKWHGNTTQVDAFCIPVTIEMGGRKVGIDKPKTEMMQFFRESAPPEFQSCLKGDWILSPCRAGFDAQGPNARYFDNYINEVWAMYATERKTPSEQWIGKVVGQALHFRPATGRGETLICETKPTTQDAFLGTGVLASNPRFCAAINRHVLADPADWNKPERFYQHTPFNFYAKFMHDKALDCKAYGFCYDDVADQSSFFSATGPEVVVTLYWDQPGPKTTK